AAPKGFESKADREKKRAADDERRRKAEEAKRRAEAAEKTREEDEQARIAAYWEALSPQDREKLRAEAFEEGDSVFVQRYRKNRNDPELSACYERLVIDSHIASLLVRKMI